MTEAEWLASTHPDAMLEHLDGQADPRLLRLFAVGCCRRIWHLLNDDRSRRAVEVAEAFAEGRASEEELDAATAAASAARVTAQTVAEATQRITAPGTPRPESAWAAREAAAAAEAAAWPELTWMARSAADSARGALRRAPTAVQAAERPAQADLLRCIFGNPFRRASTLDPVVLAWNGGVLVKLAETIYQERTFGRLVVLADALEEAGCTDAELLAHCRAGGEHARGCWAADVILGRE